MKKLLYLKLSQKETNKKLQLLLVEWHNRIRKKSRLLGWLYFIFAYIVYSSVAIISFIHCWVMLSKDFRFTPHYLQTVIDYDNMNLEQANQYLNTQLISYKKSRSYGNFSLVERDTINTTFELLLEKYKLPEPEDAKHTTILSSLSEVKTLSAENLQNMSSLNLGISEMSTELSSQMQNQNNTLKEELSNNNKQVLESVNTLYKLNDTIEDKVTNASQLVDNTLDNILNVTAKVEMLSSLQINDFSATQKKLCNISNNIELIKSTVEPITLYTEKKQQQEQVEWEHENQLRESQEKRKTTAYNREKGKKLESFESDLSDKQITILVKYCNKIAVFDRDIEFWEMKDILLCTNKAPIKLNVNRYLSSLFSELCNKGLICKTWKRVASRYKCFISSQGKDLTPNDFYMANQTSVFLDTRISDLIDECIEKISFSSN